MLDEAGLDVSVVLPTYNESASLPVLVPKIVEALARAELRGEVIVVDDASPDRTADVARTLASTLPVRVLERTDERGLATAVIAGFRMSRATVCVVMDADGSHPVEALPEMVRMILADRAEIVVGSRHVPGGGSTDWPLFSQLKSRFAASLAVGLSGMTDPTTGYMAVRRTVFERSKLDPVGWKIVLEQVVKAYPVRLAEVPIVFADRELGESKQSLRVLGQYLEHLYALYKFRFPTFVELLKFCLVGFFGLLVDLSIVYALKRAFALDTRLCQVFGFAAAVTFNFAINRRFSFEHAREAPLLRSYVTYVGTNLVGLTLRMLAIDALMRVTRLDTGSGYLLLSVIGIVLATLVNFIGVKYFAFAPDLPRTAGERDSLAPELGPRRPTTIAVVLLSLALFAFANFSGQAERTHDERVNVVMAENIAHGFEGLVHPSVTPGPVADWRRDALPALGNTPLYPALLALTLPLGSHGPDLISLLVLGTLLVGTFIALAPIDRSAAHTGALLLASSPALLAASSRREFEPLVTAFSLGGFAFAVRAFAAPHQVLFAVLAGLGVGLAFATKMWLFLPGLLACLGLIVAQAHNAEPSARQKVHQQAIVFVASTVLASLLHLAFVALTRPADLPSWIEWVYLGLFSGHGVTSTKLSSDQQSASSAWAYAGWLLRDHGALLAPLVLGLPAATRRMGRSRASLYAAIVGALLALVPLSVPAAKEPLYMMPVLPFLYALVALSLVAPDAAPARYARVNRAAAQVSLFVAGCVTLGWLWAVAFAALPAAAIALPLAQIALWCAPSLRALAGRSVAATILPCALGSLALAALTMAMGAS